MQPMGPEMQPQEEFDTQPREPKRVGRNLWRFFRPIVIAVISLSILASTVFVGVGYVNEHFFQPAEVGNNDPVLIEVPRGTSKGTIAHMLKENHLIRSEQVFKLMIDLKGMASKLKSGSYVLTPNMSMDEILNKIAQGDGRGNTTTFLHTEGSTVEELSDKLQREGLIGDVNDLRELCLTGEGYMNYPFLSTLTEEQLSGRKYALEGYLFPATYEVYVGASADTMVVKMLDKFEQIMTPERQARAEELDMTVDEVITLASVIEKEGRPNDFAKISAVFHNRMNQDMRLESCATVQYALNMKRLNLTDQDTSSESPYNTYKYKGLPAGPICSPSEKAIDAALNPDETFMSEGYLYFVTKDPESGELEFNKTYEDHLAAQNRYRDKWIEYDQKNNN